MDKQEVISPKYLAKHNYLVLGLGQHSNPYPEKAEKYLDYALEINRLQTEKLKLMINGERNA